MQGIRRYMIVQALGLCTGRTAHRRIRGIALLFHGQPHEKVWGVSVTPRPLVTPGKDPVSIVQEAGWAQGRSELVRKILPPPGFDPRTVQPVANRYTDYAARPTDIWLLCKYVSKVTEFHTWDIARIGTGFKTEKTELDSRHKQNNFFFSKVSIPALNSAPKPPVQCIMGMNLPGYVFLDLVK
jgi:hypothetical protein